MPGRTTRPLNILVVGDEGAGLVRWSDEAFRVFGELMDEGHTVEYSDDKWVSPLCEYDIILGPNCWRMTPDLLKYLKDAVKAARAQKYDTKSS